MSLNWGVTDVLAVTKLAWDLYHNCYLVAREAPDDFRQLVNELASLQGVLRTLRDDINSDKSFLDKLGENRKQALERALTTCFDTLHNLEKIVSKYRDLGVGDGLQFWKKLKWVSKQTEISDLKSKIMAHTCQISLCMTSIGNSSLTRIELQLTKALERQDQTEPASHENEDEFDELTPLTHSKTQPAQSSKNDGLNILGLNRALTGTTLHDPNMSTPSMSDEDASENFVSGPNYSNGRNRAVSNWQRDLRALPPSPSKSEDHVNEGVKAPGSSKSPLTAADSAPTIDEISSGGKNQDVAEVIADAMKELSKIRQREQLLRPLRVVRQDPDRRPDSALSERFQKLVDDELKIRRLNAKDWLRVATWWLLKARHNMRAFERHDFSSSRGSFSASGSGKSPANQAYVDLLKASWILHTIILKKENVSALTTDENRKLFYNLSDGIDDEFSMYQPVDTPDKDAFLEQDYNIWEHLQPEEETYNERDFFLGVDNARWITAEQDDAGEEDETVLFRTFVNASIGGKRFRMKSKGAPYMLILSTKEGESEPKVTICNQSGTLGLTRDFTIEDLRENEIPTSPFAEASELNVKEVLPLNFESMNVAVAFTNENDLQKFMHIPRAYFEAVKRREPRQLEKATETLIFKCSVEIFEQLRSSTAKLTNPRRQFQSCDLRVLETVGKEGWRTTRRLVISSSAAEKQPWLEELFLPLSRVQISREGNPKKVLIKWSDCNHPVPNITDGNWNPIYTYVYDDSNPNIALSLLFRTSADATHFENTVLQLSSEPVFSWTKGSDSGFIFNIFDTEPNPKAYKALLMMYTRIEWRYSELFYMYRDTDYEFDYENAKVRLPQVLYTNYISTHVGNLFKPDSNKPPRFSHCTKLVGNVLIEFGDVNIGMEFMSSLTREHKLIFSRRSHFVVTKGPSRFGSTKSSKGPAEVQLWKTREGNGMQLALRWGDNIEDRWMSLEVPKEGLDHRKDSNRAIFPKLQYSRGRKIDMSNLVARDCSKGENEKKRIGPITIAFNTVLDREQFAAALEGKELPTMKGPLDDLMMMI